MNKCIFKCKQVLGKKVTGKGLRPLLLVFACSQRARIFPSGKTQKLGLCYWCTFIRTCDNMPGSHFFFEKNVKTRDVLQLRLSRRVFTCPRRAHIFSSKKTQKLGKYWLIQNNVIIGLARNFVAKDPTIYLFVLLTIKDCSRQPLQWHYAINQ